MSLPPGTILVGGYFPPTSHAPDPPGVAEELGELLPFNATLEREIRLVRASYERLEERIGKEFAIGPGDCCPACRYGAAFAKVADKLERVRLWLGILESRRRKRKR